MALVYLVLGVALGALSALAVWAPGIGLWVAATAYASGRWRGVELAFIARCDARARLSEIMIKRRV